MKIQNALINDIPVNLILFIVWSIGYIFKFDFVIWSSIILSIIYALFLIILLCNANLKKVVISNKRIVNKLITPILIIIMGIISLII